MTLNLQWHPPDRKTAEPVLDSRASSPRNARSACEWFLHRAWRCFSRIAARGGSSLFLASGTTLDSLAVLPFVNVSADPGIEYLSDGIAESIINNMSQLPKLSIRSFTSVARYKSRDVNPQAIGRELNVQAVLTGRLIHRGDQFDVNVELIDVRHNRQIWGSQYHPKTADLMGSRSRSRRKYRRS